MLLSQIRSLTLSLPYQRDGIARKFPRVAKMRQPVARAIEDVSNNLRRSSVDMDMNPLSVRLILSIF
jgi:hypothetical protein